ncbi:MAG: hypothetical protein ABSC30_08815 [Acidimicrobiales bacterium]|jgi:hypothetical protein
MNPVQRCDEIIRMIDEMLDPGRTESSTGLASHQDPGPDSRFTHPRFAFDPKFALTQFIPNHLESRR